MENIMAKKPKKSPAKKPTVKQTPSVKPKRIASTLAKRIANASNKEGIINYPVSTKNNTNNNS